MLSHRLEEVPLMYTRCVRTLLAAGMLAVAVGFAVPVLAAEASGHDHGEATPVLKLDAGKKWQTDAPLRQGMTSIRSAVETALPAVHAGTFPDAAYTRLGETVEGQIGYIVQNCKLDPEADAVLHAVIADLSGGADILTGKAAAGSRSEGVVRLVKGLDSYGSYFSHPGWRAVAEAH
jgi:hypothetical protein